MRKIKDAFARFMMGRYGTDKLNMLLLSIGVVVTIVALFVRNDLADLVMMLVSYGLMGVVFFRCLSRNIYKRYQENRKYLLFLQKIKDREHRYYDCPKCRQQVRVPRGKGKISITCPKCREKFIRKT